MTTLNLPLKNHAMPNMTPMVDVVMCILIFFMLGSTFIAPEFYLTNRMPAVDIGPGTERSYGEPAVRGTLVLHRQPSGQTTLSAFDSAPMTMSKIDDLDQSASLAILSFLEQKKRSGMSDDVQLIIMPDRLVPYQDVITIYDYCIKAKFTQVAFAPAR